MRFSENDYRRCVLEGGKEKTGSCCLVFEDNQRSHLYIVKMLASCFPGLRLLNK